MEVGFLAEWLRDRTEVVLAAAEEYVRSRAQIPPQRRLLETALVGLRQQALAQEVMPSVHLPLLVYSSLQGDDLPAVPLAAATAILYLGIDIIDDLADGDRPQHWEGYRTAEISLAGTILICPMAQLALADLPVPCTRLAVMQRTLSQGLLTMAAGQLVDLGCTGGSEVPAETIEASVVAKSGGEFALFTALAAQFAGAEEGVVALYARMGEAFGTGSQIVSASIDLFQQAHSRDLASGTRTVPIACHLERLIGQERARFLELLDLARTDPDAQTSVRTILREAGVLRRCMVLAALYRQRALSALAEAPALDPGRAGLRALIDQLLFSPSRP